MENVVKYFNTIETSFKRTKFLTICCIVATVVISLGSIVFAAIYVSSHNDNIYLVDSTGSAMTASKFSEDQLQRENEIDDHVRRFHEFMFNLSPSRDAINTNMERAFVMCDKSAFKYYNRQDERGFYSQLENENIVQYIIVDSIAVNMSVYPYQERTYGRLYISRDSNLSKYIFESSGQLVEVGRSKNNPHGLMLENFNVSRQDFVETRKRK